MAFWFKFAVRSCLRRRRRTIITLTGIAFAVAMLVVLGAIMVGVNDTIVRNAVALRSGDLAVIGEAAIARDAAARRLEQLRSAAATEPDIQGALPRMQLSGILKTDTATQPCVVTAVEPKAEARFAPIKRNTVRGAYLNNPDDFIIGSAAAKELDVDVGDTVTLITPFNSYSMKLTGIFKTGVDQFDRSVAFVPLSSVIFEHESLSLYEVAFFVQPGVELAGLKQKIGASIGAGESLKNWTELMPEVAQLVDLNKFSMNIMIALVVAILGFGVANALLISVMDRFRAFAVLKAIGVRPKEIVILIVFEAMIMCVAAGVFGTLLGAFAGAIWGNIGLDLSRYTSYNPNFSVNPVVHPRLTLFMTLAPQCLALCAGIIASFGPAILAARRRVNTTLREIQ